MYPFGLQHKGYNNVITSTNPAQKYKYNGKELQDELGLNQYDYGARFYDPATARWFTPDAMAEKYYDQSVYNYTVNNPVLYIDPDGNQVAMCCDGLVNWLKDLQTRGSAWATRTSQKADKLFKPARDFTNRTGAWTTRYSRAVASFSKPAIDEHISKAKALYNIQAQMGGLGVGLSTGLRVAGVNMAAEGSTLQKILKTGENADVSTIVAQTADDIRYLDAMNAEAVFMTGEGGTILMREGAAVETIAEELIHFEQYKEFGEAYFLKNRTSLEIDAQNQLIKIGKEEGWSKEVINRFERAKESWQKLLNEETKRRTGS